MSQYADQRGHDVAWMTARERNEIRSTIGTSRNPLTAWHGERAIRAGAFGDVRQDHPRKPDDVSTALLAIRLYCEREGLDFAALVAGIGPVTA